MDLELVNNVLILNYNVLLNVELKIDFIAPLSFRIIIVYFYFKYYTEKNAAPTFLKLQFFFR